jgi:hypothetical protein
MAITAENEWRRHSRRSELIGLVLEFVLQVRGVDGVREISLIGSLCTPKDSPRDADLLVTINDDADLTVLAKHSRRLQGKAQSIGHGSDVFLLSPADEYLGRVCQWKECRPGIRIRCDALHCGKREFLHDDLGAVLLGTDVIAVPPLKLWPEIVVRNELPPDISDGLVRPLRDSYGQNAAE